MSVMRQSPWTMWLPTIVAETIVALLSLFPETVAGEDGPLTVAVACVAVVVNSAVAPVGPSTALSGTNQTTTCNHNSSGQDEDANGREPHVELSEIWH